MHDALDAAGVKSEWMVPPDRALDEFLMERLRGALEELGVLARGTGEHDAVDRAYDGVSRLRQLRQALKILAQGRTAGETTPVYLVSASFLTEASHALTRSHDEDLLYATGPEDGKTLFALTRLVAFKLAEKSVAHAVPDPASQIAALTELDRREERLLAAFHSHPGRGAGATTPSSVDLSTQAGLEQMGYPTIGAIFGRNGFVRFFSANRPFRVVVSGAGIEQVDEQLFRASDVAEKSFLRKVISHDSRS